MPRKSHPPTQPVTAPRPKFPSRGGARIAQDPDNPDHVRIVSSDDGQKLPWNTELPIIGTVKGIKT